MRFNFLSRLVYRYWCDGIKCVRLYTEFGMQWTVNSGLRRCVSERHIVLLRHISQKIISGR